MGKTPELIEIERLLSDADATFVRETKHSYLYAVGDERVGVPKTAGDVRSWRNALARVRRACRVEDVEENAGEMPEEEEAVTMSMEELGVYTGPTKVKVIREESKTVAAPLASIARLLTGEEGWTVTGGVEGDTLTLELTRLDEAESTED